MSNIFFDAHNGFNSQGLIIFYSLTIGIPLMIWIAFNINKIVEKIKNKKD